MGRRPTATRTLSAVKLMDFTSRVFSADGGLGAFDRDVGDFGFELEGDAQTFEVFLQDAHCIEVKTGAMRSRNSTTVTLAPRRPHLAQFKANDAAADNDQILAPFKAIAWSEVITTLPSTLANGSSIGTEPIAKQMCSAVTVVSLPSASVTERWCRSINSPVPAMTVILFFFIKKSMPLINSMTTPSLRSIMASTFSLGLPTVMPCSSRPCATSWKRSHLNPSNALEGIQPTFRQVPPKAATFFGSFVRFSTMATFRPQLRGANCSHIPTRASAE